MSSMQEDVIAAIWSWAGTSLAQMEDWRLQLDLLKRLTATVGEKGRSTRYETL
jgi:hypothetical protein